MKKKNRHIGSSLDEFLKEEGILEETRAAALKEAIAWQVQKAMKRAKINKVEMARRMNTSRAALDRLLDPGNASVTLQTLCRAARAIGRDLPIFPFTPVRSEGRAKSPAQPCTMSAASPRRCRDQAAGPEPHGSCSCDAPSAPC